MSQEIVMRAEETHKAITRHYAEMGARYADLDVSAQTWTTSSASGACAYVFIYLQVDLNLNFPDGLSLTFNGKGLVAGLGATGTLGGQASFNVDPHTLKNAEGITFQAAGIGIGVGGFQVTFFKDNTYIGHAEFYGAGVQLGTPGGGWGTFS
ncbi:hypothetical protein [Azohydromonas caseinilytica]|uniref:Ysc84 actin-binding domain-containing protein n=1 Tax=Azohydromonas caseinilytica TaxID=2728836 RepID=A0A848FHD2_9BURK|nr:hypothetical protein [Azohydromonas caseinilytica]NML17610.1 hypothetical protein [Azohydromonas caseinilytica]